MLDLRQQPNFSNDTFLIFLSYGMFDDHVAHAILLTQRWQGRCIILYSFWCSLRSRQLNEQRNDRES